MPAAAAAGYGLELGAAVALVVVGLAVAALTGLLELQTQAAAVEAELKLVLSVQAAQAVPALLLSVMQIHLQRLPQQVVQRLPSLAVTEFTHSPDLGALLSNGTLRTG
jgi:hypothetical protein